MQKKKKICRCSKNAIADLLNQTQQWRKSVFQVFLYATWVHHSCSQRTLPPPHTAPRSSPVFAHIRGSDINFYGELCHGGKSRRPPWFKAALIVFPWERQAFSPQPPKEQTNKRQTQQPQKKKKRERQINSIDRSFQLRPVCFLGGYFSTSPSSCEKDTVGGALLSSLHLPTDSN